MEISHASHQHTLILKHANCPYYCWGCGQLGFGLTYICSKGCNFFLHSQCGRPIAEIKYPFSDECVLRFRDGGSGVDSPCDACGKKIKRFHYRCTCTFLKRNVHPFCLANEQTFETARGLTLHLAKEATSKCLYCGTKERWLKVRRWAYVSSCGTYCYHVSCVREIINNNWKHSFFSGKSDPFFTIKERFPEDVDRVHKITAARKKDTLWKHAEASLSIIFSVLTGNPSGLVGAAKAYFGG